MTRSRPTRTLLPPHAQGLATRRRARRVRAGIAMAALVLGLSTACGLKDIRPDPTLAPTAAAQQDGHARLKALAEAHGGLATLRAARVAEVDMQDVWAGGLMQAFMPWPENGTMLRLTAELGTDTSRLTYLDGAQKGHIMGIQDWVTYTRAADAGQETAGDGLVLRDDDTTKFWLPTMQYFLTAPFRLHEATVAYTVGETRFDGRIQDIVFASWGTAKPQDSTDQYLVYIDRQTGRLSRLEYTVRDFGGQVAGGMDYLDHTQTGGLWFAHTMRTSEVYGAPMSLHEMRVKAVRLVPETDAKVLRPFAGQRGHK